MQNKSAGLCCRGSSCSESQLKTYLLENEHLRKKVYQADQAWFGHDFSVLVAGLEICSIVSLLKNSD